MDTRAGIIVATIEIRWMADIMCTVLQPPVLLPSQARQVRLLARATVAVAAAARHRSLLLLAQRLGVVVVRLLVVVQLVQEHNLLRHGPTSVPVREVPQPLITVAAQGFMRIIPPPAPAKK